MDSVISTILAASSRAAAYLTRTRALFHSLGSDGRGIGAALPPFIQVEATEGLPRIGAALRAALGAPAETPGTSSRAYVMASSRRRIPWPSWARKLLRTCSCCFAIRSDAGIAIVPTKKVPSRTSPRAFLDLEGRLSWLPPSASDEQIGRALLEAFAKCE